jgi:hypothetical protein
MPSKAYLKSATGHRSWKVTLNTGASYYPLGVESQSAKSNTWTNSVTYGDNVPGYRQLIRDGENATTALSGQRSRVRVENGTLSFSATAGVERKALLGGFCGNMSLDPPGTPSGLNEAKADTEALGRFAVRVVNARSSIQGGVFVGELGQTLRMIKSPAQGLRRLVDDWRGTAIRLRRARNFLPLNVRKRTVAQDLADSWLEYAFGWKPLINDIKSGCEALDKLAVGRSGGTIRCTGTASTTVSVSDSSSIHGSGIALWTESLRTVGTTMVIYRGAVRVEASNPKTMDTSLFGFSPEQFVPTAWELIPYSFLIDYFTNIGDIIYGWSSLLANVAWCNRTVRKTYETTRTTSSSKQVTSNFQSCVPAKVIGETTSVLRAKYIGTRVPDFTFQVPSLGSMRWLNIAALIASRGSDRKWSYD